MFFWSFNSFVSFHLWLVHSFVLFLFLIDNFSNKPNWLTLTKNLKCAQLDISASVHSLKSTQRTFLNVAKALNRSKVCRTKYLCDFDYEDILLITATREVLITITELTVFRNRWSCRFIQDFHPHHLRNLIFIFWVVKGCYLPVLQTLATIHSRINWMTASRSLGKEKFINKSRIVSDINFTNSAAHVIANRSWSSCWWLFAHDHHF